MKKQPEYELQKAVCRYLDAQYPNILYMSDTVASVKLTGAQGERNKATQKQGFKCPDLLIFKPSNGYHGLFIELKVKDIYRKDDPTVLLKNEHVEGQAKTIAELNELEYFATFGIGFDDVKRIIDEYLK